MIPATQDSLLKTNIDKHVESLGLKVKVIGTKLSETIKGQIITPIPKCLDPKCLICKSGGNQKLCRAKKVMYSIEHINLTRSMKTETKEQSWRYNHAKNDHNSTRKIYIMIQFKRNS